MQNIRYSSGNLDKTEELSFTNSIKWDNFNAPFYASDKTSFKESVERIIIDHELMDIVAKFAAKNKNNILYNGYVFVKLSDNCIYKITDIKLDFWSNRLFKNIKWENYLLINPWDFEENLDSAIHIKTPMFWWSGNHEARITSIYDMSNKKEYTINSNWNIETQNK